VGDVGAMFIFDTKERPHPTTSDFGEANEEGHYGIVLEITGVNGVEDPVEAEYRI